MGDDGPRRRDKAGPDAARTTIVGGRPPEAAAIPRAIPRGIEVLVKKAAVDPAFRDMLLEKRAEAAQSIGLKLTPEEAAMLAAVPLAQLEGIIAHTRVSPKLRPAFLGYAATAMLAALGIGTSCSKKAAERRDIDLVKGHTVAVIEERHRADPEEIPTGEIPADRGVITGVVYVPEDFPVTDVVVTLEGSDAYAIPGEKGDFVFNQVAPGEYNLIVADPYTNEEIAFYEGIEVIAGERTPVWVQIEDGSRSPDPCAGGLGIRPDLPPKKGKLYVEGDSP
ncbi:MAG: Os1348 family NHLP clan protein [Candidatus Zixiibacteriota bacterium]|jgi:hypothetical protein